MKKLMLLSILLLASIFVNAQRGRSGNPEMHIEKRMNHLTSELDLSVDQQAQLKEIFVAEHQNRKAGGQKMRDMSKEEKEAFRAERKEAKAAMDAKIAAILTPTQLTTFQNLAAERKANQDGRKPAKGEKGRRGRKHKQKAKDKNKAKASPQERAQNKADKLTDELDLDANQQTAVYDLFLKQASKEQLNKAERGQLSKEEKRLLKENRQKNKAAFEAELAEILTAAQFEKFKSLPKKGRKQGKRNRR